MQSKLDKQHCNCKASKNYIKSDDIKKKKH